MVATTVEKLSPTRVKLNITVTPDELKPSIKHAYEHIAESVNIPGFRKGKVPPPIIDQRVGRAEVLNHAVSDGLDRFYKEAADEAKLRPLGRPEADVTQWPEEKDFSGDLQFSVEVDVRPDFTIPAYDKLTLEVDPVTVTPDEVENELENLRSRFGTLVTVDRPAKKGDFVSIDLIATIGGEEVDTAANISYELGSGELIDGIDDALETLTAGEDTTFEAPLLGGDHEGEAAQIAVTVLAVKERELPAADDDFAQIASQFDTIGELRADLREQLGKSKEFGQGVQA
ncbi:MAG: trigger factor, partial [Schumannella sp.]|nr:trigger factor [Schumannella sp.]